MVSSMSAEFIMQSGLREDVKRRLASICSQCEVYGCGMAGGYAPYSNRYINEVTEALAQGRIGKKAAAYFIKHDRDCYACLRHDET